MGGTDLPSSSLTSKPEEDLNSIAEVDKVELIKKFSVHTTSPTRIEQIIIDSLSRVVYSTTKLALEKTGYHDDISVCFINETSVSCGRRPQVQSCLPAGC